ncbi:MAG: formimidoylglutamate deiminase [Alphaproteobacteria bacterium]|nr:formimidoylglutamate deiminase [Alphaproteobacteria bacterium]
MKTLFASMALLSTGWAKDVVIEINSKGIITKLTSNSSYKSNYEQCNGPVLPGMPNVHSHVFQRMLAGLAEQKIESKKDTFWSWREKMYYLVNHLTPDQIHVIASQTYVEMLKSGYTSVGEFHYLHNNRDGAPYQDIAEISNYLIEAATYTGIGMTLLPVLYSWGGFGQTPLSQAQKRFSLSLDQYLNLIEKLYNQYRDSSKINVGFAPHSLRAVSPDLLDEIVKFQQKKYENLPFHIHVAEQIQEVEQALYYLKNRPIAWLLERYPVGNSWCFVHATHSSDNEINSLIRSKIIVGLCPTTEANLGDGLFSAHKYINQGGTMAIGSDSQISINPIEELRWLEYGQRLINQQRILLIGSDTSLALNLWKKSVEGGARALARSIGGLQVNNQADLIILNNKNPNLYNKTYNQLIDSFIFSTNYNAVQDVMVSGKWVVKNFYHDKEEEIFEKFKGILLLYNGL